MISLNTIKLENKRMAISDLVKEENNGKQNYNPASFHQQEASVHRNQVDPTGGTPTSTLGALFANNVGNLLINESHVLASINPVVDAIVRDKGLNLNRGFSVVTLSSKDHPGLLADYIVVGIERNKSHYIKPMLICSTVTVQLTSYEVPVGPIKTQLPRTPADLMDAKAVQEAIDSVYASKVGITTDRLGVLGESYLHDDFAAMSAETLRKVLEQYITLALMELNFIFAETAQPIISYANLTAMGYSPELRVSSTKGDLYRPITTGGTAIPSHAVIEISAEKYNKDQNQMRNGRTDIFSGGGNDRYVAANASIVLDLILSRKPVNQNEPPHSQFLAPLICITATNFGNSKRDTAGIVSKFLGVIGALIYARENNGISMATWFNLAIDQQQRFEQGGKNGGKGITANWQTIPWAGRMVKDLIKFDATKSNGQEMAEVLLDQANGFIYPGPLFAMDLSRGSESGAVDSILLEAFNGSEPAMAQVLSALDAATDGRFSAFLGNAPIFMNGYDMVIPDGEGMFNGEIRNLREITLPAVATRAYASNDTAIIDSWLNYQLSTVGNSESNLAAVYDQVYASMGTNVRITSMYHRLLLTPEFVGALEKAFFDSTQRGGALSLRDNANLTSWASVGQGHHGGLRYSNGVGSSNVNYGGYSNASRGYGIGGNRFSR